MLMDLLQKHRLQVIRISNHLATRDFFHARAPETELAMSEAFFRPQRRTEDPAGHRTMLVQVAGAGCGVECGTRFAIAKFLEGFFGFGIVRKDAGIWVARKFSP